MTHHPQFDVRYERRWNFYPLPDLLLFLFLLCIARQYLWTLGGSVGRNAAAWALSTVVAGCLVFLISRERGSGWEGTESTLEPGWHSWRYASANSKSRGFAIDWLWAAIVVAPLLIYFFLRAAFPAFELDHLNYHMVNTERALRGWPMIKGDFFPGTLLVNPAPDMAFGVLKYLIGYRLAPVLNIAALLWTANLLNEIVAPILPKKAIRYFAVLFIVATDQISYLVNIYMIDLLSLPLLLAAALLVIRLDRSRNPGRSLVMIALWLGISVAFKLTNAFFAIPICVLCLFELIKLYREKRYLPRLVTVVTTMLAGVLPAIFFFGYMFSQTGNPLFPYYNGVFKSPLMVPLNYHDARMGPEDLLQKILWPVISFVYPTSLSAMNTALVYSGRLNVGFVFALSLLLWRQTPASFRKIGFIMVMGSCVWSFGSGDLRYALIGEVFGGIVCCFIFKYLYDQTSALRRATWTSSIKTRIAFVLVIGFVALQTLFGFWFGLVHFECASENQLCDRVMQPVITNKLTAVTFKRLIDLDMPRHIDFERNYSYLQEARYFFRDREAQDFYTDADKAQFRDVDVWVNCSDGSSAYMAMASQRIPMISVAKFLYLFDYMESPGARARVNELFKENRSKKMYTIVQPERYQNALDNLAQVGLKPGEPKPISIPMYSPNIRAHLLLIQLTPSDD